MISNNRIYDYVGQITLKKNYVLKVERLPDEDIDPWLFLVLDKSGERRFTFFYKIENPLEVINNETFRIQMSFIMDGMEKTIQIGQTYDVWRGEEPIGIVKIINILK